MEQRTPDAKQTKRKLLDQTAQTLIAALLLGSASGCATMDYDDGYSRPPMYSARLSPRPVRIVQVLPGDTIESVAQRFNVSEEAIVEANDLRAPYRLRRGQSLVLPPSSVHIVSSGETIASIARSYGVSPNVIVDVNNLHAPDTLYPGERLTIPYVAPRQVARVERIPQAVTRDELAPPAAEQRETGIDPRLAGARYYGSGLPRHKPGPTGEGGPEFSSPRQITNADPADEAFDASHHAKPRQVASIDPADEAFDAPARHGKPATPDAPVKASSRFVWPVHGQIISTFGKRSNGVHNDGINIAAEPGSSVVSLMAAEPIGSGEPGQRPTTGVRRFGRCTVCAMPLRRIQPAFRCVVRTTSTRVWASRRPDQTRGSPARAASTRSNGYS